MITFKFLLPICACALLSIISSTTAQTDLTLVPGSKGRDVTEASIRKIKRHAIFGEDYDFSRRTGWVETKFGDDPKTYRPGYFGGIWQVDEDYYEQTKDVATYPRLSPLHASISARLGIQWGTTDWDNLQAPLYSALAFRLFFAGVINIPIPGSLISQSGRWVIDYSRNTTEGLQQMYIDQVRELEQDPVCQGRMDICITVDGSGSVGLNNFDIAKGFVADLVNTFDIGPEHVKTGFVQYETSVYTRIPVENTFDKAQLNYTIRNTMYTGGGTNTGDGIMRSVDLLLATTPRQGVPKVMTILTDGQATQPIIEPIARAQREGIVSFAVGIGQGINTAELRQIAYGDETHVFELDGFDSLSEFFYRMGAETCLTPQKPGINETVDDNLKQGEKRYYSYNLPPEGITLQITLQAGYTHAYYSYTEEVPSSAMNDGESRGEELLYIPANPHSPRLPGNIVYIAIEGMEANNEYQLELLPGNQEPTTFEPTTTTEEPTTTTEESTTPGPLCNPDDVYDIPVPNNCTAYIRCIYGEEFPRVCGEGQAFDPSIGKCNLAELVGCDGIPPRPTPKPICLNPVGTYYLPYTGNCTLYYVCSKGIPILFSCAPGLLFDYTTLDCVREEVATCAPEPSTPIPPTDAPPLCSNPDTLYYRDYPGDCLQYILCNYGNPIFLECAPGTQYDPLVEKCVLEENYDCPYNSTATNQPGTATPGDRYPCPNAPHAYMPDPDTCEAFYVCMNGQFVASYSCGDGLWFDSISQDCVAPELSDCPHVPKR